VDKEAKAFSSEPFTQQQQPNSATPLTSFQDLAAKGKKKTKGQQRAQTEAEPTLFSPISPTSEGDASLGQSEWPSQSSGSDTRSNVPLVPIHQQRQPTTSRNPREKTQAQAQAQVGPDYFSSRPPRRQPTPGNANSSDTPWDHPISPPPAYHDYRWSTFVTNIPFSMDTTHQHLDSFPTSIFFIHITLQRKRDEVLFVSLTDITVATNNVHIA
jgi:hypothetical protein